MNTYTNNRLAGAALATLLILGQANVRAQALPLEVVLGHRAVMYQHTLSKALGSKGFEFFNTSSVIAPYSAERRDELMSQSYVRYAVKKHWKLGLGGFYASVPRFAPSASLQFFTNGKRYKLVLGARLDLRPRPAFDVLLVLERKTPLNNRLSLHSLLQVMFNVAACKHARSYQYVRLGLDDGHFQSGFAANFDAYGPQLLYRYNYGIYFKKLIL